MAEMKTYSFEELLDNTFGPVGTTERDKFQKDVEEEIYAYRVGEAIRRARKEKRLTQQQLGDMIGVQKSQISRFEKGKNITINSLTRIFRALDLTANLEVSGIGVVALC